MKSIFLNVFATMGIAAVTCVIILIIAASAPPPEETAVIVDPTSPTASVAAPKPESGPWDSLVSAFRKRLMSTAKQEAAKQAAAPATTVRKNGDQPSSYDSDSKPEDSFIDYSPSVATSHISSTADRTRIGGSSSGSGSESASTQKIRGFFGSSGGSSGGGSGGGGGGGGGIGGSGESYEDKLAKSLGESLTPEEMDELIANQQDRAQEK